MTHADGGKVIRERVRNAYRWLESVAHGPAIDKTFAPILIDTENLLDENALLEQQLERAQGELRERLSQLQYTRDERDANYRLLCDANKRAEQAEARVKELEQQLGDRLECTCDEDGGNCIYYRLGEHNKTLQAHLATATARVTWLERLHTQFLLRLPQDDTWYEDWLAAEPQGGGEHE